MMRSRIKANDNWFRFLGIPFLAIMSHVIFFNENHGQADEKFTYWQVWLISAFEAILLWEGNRLVLLYFRRKYPLLDQTAMRITYQVAGCTIATILIRYLNIYLYDKTLFWGYIFPVEGYVYNVFVALLYVAVIGSLYEGVYYFRSWKEMFKEKELLKREYLQTQLSSLKEQINPHFLFNNFSSLASLVMEDQQKAVEFINELSSVYRYLLQTNNEPFVTLKEELSFIEHYFHLLKTRFGQGIELNVSVPEHMLTSHLPPLTLQLLVENAVKHNAVLDEAPLNIHIFVKDNQVIVENEIQLKSTPVFSSKTGLDNIRQKFKLLGGKPVQVVKENNLFRVIIPLFNDAHYEVVDSRR